MGLDVDLLNAIAERENLTFTFVAQNNPEHIFRSLEDGSVDIVATGVNITSERLAKYEFSKPYLEGSWVALLNRKKVQIDSWQDLKNRKIAVQSQTSSEAQLQASNITDKPILFKTLFLGLQAVNSGVADAIYDVDSILNTYLKDNPNYYTVIDETAGKIPFGFVMKKGNTELKAKLDKGLDDIRADGTYQKIIDKWYPKQK